MAFVHLKKNPVVRLFSSFAHYELTLNPFRQHCSNQILTWAKFLEIQTTGSLENGTFLLKQSVSIFRATAHALHLTGNKAENCWVLRIVTFCNRRFYKILKPSIHCMLL